MADIFTWLYANWDVIVSVAGVVVMAASLVVKAIAPLTDSTRDDRLAVWLDRVYGWLNTIALNPKKDTKKNDSTA